MIIIPSCFTTLLKVLKFTIDSHFVQSSTASVYVASFISETKMLIVVVSIVVPTVLRVQYIICGTLCVIFNINASRLTIVCVCVCGACLYRKASNTPCIFVAVTKNAYYAKKQTNKYSRYSAFVELVFVRTKICVR